MKKKQTTAAIEQAEKALCARVRLLEKAKARVSQHKWRLDEQVKALHELKCKTFAPTTDEFRLRIAPQEPYFWSEKSMLDQVFGDSWCDDAGDNHRCDASCEPNEDAREYINAYNGRGVYGWCGFLEQRHRVTQKWEVVDTCGGFYSTTDSAPEDEIREQLTSDQSEGCELVYGEDES